MNASSEFLPLMPQLTLDMFCCSSLLSRGKPSMWWDWGAGPGRAREGEFLELCSCFAKCAILLSFRERKWDFLPQSPAEPFIFFKHFVIHPSSRTSLTPGCLLSDWDLPLAGKKGETQWHGGRLFQTLFWLPRLARQADSPCSSTAFTMITSTPSQGP